MAKRTSLGPLLFLFAVVLPTSSLADDRRAAPGTFLFQIGQLGDGMSIGTVRAVELAEKVEKGGASTPNLVLTSSEVTPALGVMLEGFVANKPLKTNVRLSTGAVVKKATDARLATVKLPSMGAGHTNGAAEIELGFLAPNIVTQPVLSLKQASARSPQGGRIDSFRVDMTGIPSLAASKLDAITMSQKDGLVVPSAEIIFEVGAGGAPPFTAWSKTPKAAKTMTVEYVGGDGNALVKMKLDACTPQSVTPLGASGTTRIVVKCASVKPA